MEDYEEVGYGGLEISNVWLKRICFKSYPTLP